MSEPTEPKPNLPVAPKPALGWPPKRWLQRHIFPRRWLTFLVMGLSFFIFGAGTLNLFYVFQANVDLLSNYGWDAVMEGGLLQLVQIIATGYASLIAYVVFKACEYQLTHWLHEEKS